MAEPLFRPTVLLATVLAAASGSVDVLAITRLGGAFASIITGNVAVVGVAVGEQDLQRGLHAGLAVLAYAAGVLLGSVITHDGTDDSGNDGDGGRWRARVPVTYALELAALALLATIWVGSTGHPAGGVKFVGLAAAAIAMGLQSAAFRLAHIGGVNTTYFTGTLTGLLSVLVAKGRLNRPALVALIALLAGAIATGAVLVRADRWAGMVPAALLVVAVLLCGICRRSLLV